MAYMPSDPMLMHSQRTPPGFDTLHGVHPEGPFFPASPVSYFHDDAETSSDLSEPRKSFSKPKRGSNIDKYQNQPFEVDYEGFLLEKGNTLDGTRPSWTRARIENLPYGNAKLAEISRKSRVSGTAESFIQLKQPQRDIINRLIQQRQDNEESSNVEWVLDTIHRYVERSVWRNTGECKKMRLILKRIPKALSAHGDAGRSGPPNSNFIDLSQPLFRATNADERKSINESRRHDNHLSVNRGYDRRPSLAQHNDMRFENNFEHSGIDPFDHFVPRVQRQVPSGQHHLPSYEDPLPYRGTNLNGKTSLSRVAHAPIHHHSPPLPPHAGSYPPDIGPNQGSAPFNGHHHLPQHVNGPPHMHHPPSNGSLPLPPQQQPPPPPPLTHPPQMNSLPQPPGAFPDPTPQNNHFPHPNPFSPNIGSPTDPHSPSWPAPFGPQPPSNHNMPLPPHPEPPIPFSAPHLQPLPHQKKTKTKTKTKSELSNNHFARLEGRLGDLVDALRLSDDSSADSLASRHRHAGGRRRSSSQESAEMLTPPSTPPSSPGRFSSRKKYATVKSKGKRFEDGEREKERGTWMRRKYPSITGAEREMGPERAQTHLRVRRPDEREEEEEEKEAMRRGWVRRRRYSDDWGERSRSRYREGGFRGEKERERGREREFKERRRYGRYADDDQEMPPRRRQRSNERLSEDEYSDFELEKRNARRGRGRGWEKDREVLLRDKYQW